MIETSRLILRKLSLSDSAFIIWLLNTPEWLENVGDRHVHTLEDAHAYLLNGPIKSYDLNGFGLRAIQLKGSDTLIGVCGLIKRYNFDDVDIGYALFSRFMGNGYAFEASKATIDYGFNQLNLNRIVAVTTEENIRSRNLLARLGSRFETEMIMPGSNDVLFLYAVNKHQ